MNNTQRGTLVGALLGDALSLGAHWIYDTNEITTKFGQFDGYTDPALNPYHSKKKIGDFTHYGDQMVILIESIKKEGGYNPESYMQDWVKTMQSYSGYMDHATKVTLENINNGGDITSSGSPSSDGSAIGRIAPLLALANTSDEQITTYVSLTHNHEMVQSAAIFFADIVRAVQSGVAPHEAIQNANSTSPEILAWRDAGVASTEMSTIDAIKKFGQSCGVDSCFPGVIHCIVKYGDDFKSALIENAKAGGDSAARGMIIGMILGASLGYDKLPIDWIERMNYKVV